MEVKSFSYKKSGKNATTFNEVAHEGKDKCDPI